MLGKARQRHYLARLYDVNNEEPSRVRSVNLVARALYPARGVKRLSVVQARIVGISESGAILQSSKIELIPDHFYLCLGHFEIFLTCAKLRSGKDGIFVRFSEFQDQSFVDSLCLIDFPLDTMHKMRGKHGRMIDLKIMKRS